MRFLSPRRRVYGAGAILSAAIISIAFLAARSLNIEARDAPGADEPATPAAVAAIEPRDLRHWEEYSGRLEAVERVEVRSRVAGAVLSVHFREGALVDKGDLLITIDPAPYAAEADRARAELAAAQARVAVARKEWDRAVELKRTGSSAISQSTVDLREGAYREAEAALHSAEAALQSAQLNLGYTQIRAPVAGRVGKLEVTVGNLIDAGPSGPLLTTLVSIDPIYASFHSDEDVVLRMLGSLGEGDAYASIGRIPVQMVTSRDQAPIKGRLQLIDNQVDAATGTVRVRAEFDNPDGRLLPGQFVRLRMGEPATQPSLLVSERAIGTDLDKRFVLVVNDHNRAEYREVTLGPSTDGMRVVTSGLKAGERIIVSGLQLIRPGALIAPQPAGMEQQTASAAMAQR